MKTLPPRKQYLFIALITLFLALLAFQLGTGIMLFFLKLGLAPNQWKAYYLGTAIIPPKSLEGLYHSVIPHMAAISVVNLVVAHFLMMLERPVQKLKLIWIAVLFFSGLSNSLAGLLIRFIDGRFVFLKFSCFLIYECSLLGAVFWLALCLGKQMRSAVE